MPSLPTVRFAEARLLIWRWVDHEFQAHSALLYDSRISSTEINLDLTTTSDNGERSRGWWECFLALKGLPVTDAELTALEADACECLSGRGDAPKWYGARIMELIAEVRGLRAIDSIPPERVSGLPLTLVQVEALLRSLPKPLTAPEAWLVDRVQDVVFTLRHEQEMHRETRDEWVSACERADGAFAEVTELRCEVERLRGDRALLARAIWSCPEIHDGANEPAEELVRTVLGGGQ